MHRSLANTPVPGVLTSQHFIPPSFPLTRVLSDLFASLCDSADKRFSDHQGMMRVHLSIPGAHAFEAAQVPAISIAQYIERIKTYSECPPECFVSALIFIDRLIAVHKGFALHSRNFHRLFLVSTMMSTKFFEDSYYNNAYWAKVGGVTVTEMNVLELNFLQLIEFQLGIGAEQYDQYFAELLFFAEREKLILPEEALLYRNPSHFMTTPPSTPQHYAVAAASRPTVQYDASQPPHPVVQLKSPLFQAASEHKHCDFQSPVPPHNRRSRRRPRHRRRNHANTKQQHQDDAAVMSQRRSEENASTKGHVDEQTYDQSPDSAGVQNLSKMGLKSPQDAYYGVDYDLSPKDSFVCDKEDSDNPAPTKHCKSDAESIRGCFDRNELLENVSNPIPKSNFVVPEFQFQYPVPESSYFVGGAFAFPTVQNSSTSFVASGTFEFPQSIPILVSGAAPSSVSAARNEPKCSPTESCNMQARFPSQHPCLTLDYQPSHELENTEHEIAAQLNTAPNIPLF
jgi:hypothetical protein